MQLRIQEVHQVPAQVLTEVEDENSPGKKKVKRKKKEELEEEDYPGDAGALSQVACVGLLFSWNHLFGCVLD